MGPCQKRPVSTSQPGGKSPAGSSSLCSAAYRPSASPGGGVAAVDDGDVDGPADRLADPAGRLARRESVHPPALGQEVGDEHDRPLDRLQLLRHALHQQGRHQAGVEASGTNHDRVERAQRLRHRRVHGDLRVQPDALDAAPLRLLGVDRHLAARPRPVLVLRADGRMLDAHRPDAPAAVEQRAQRIDRGQEVPAAALHHRQQEVPARVAAQTSVLQRRQPREQHAARLGLVARQGQRAAQHVAGRQDPDLVAELPRAAAAVERGDDGVDPDPGILLQPADQAGQAGASAEAPDVQLRELHPSHYPSPRVGHHCTCRAPPRARTTHAVDRICTVLRVTLVSGPPPPMRAGASGRHGRRRVSKSS